MRCVVSAMVTRDGSPVELYTILRHTGEADIIRGAVRPGGSILELGAGARWFASTPRP